MLFCTILFLFLLGIIFSAFCFFRKMPRTFKRIIGTWNHKNYSEDQLNKALNEVIEGSLSIRAASNRYKIPLGTIYNKYKGWFGRKPEGKTVFLETEEKALLKAAAKCSDWGYPLMLLDLRFFAKACLERQGRQVKKKRIIFQGLIGFILGWNGTKISIRRESQQT